MLKKGKQIFNINIIFILKIIDNTEPLLFLVTITSSLSNCISVFRNTRKSHHGRHRVVAPGSAPTL